MNEPTEELLIRQPEPDELDAVAELLGVAMAENPNHVAVYRGDASVRASRHALLMRSVLGRRPGEMHLGAFCGREVVGFVAAVPSPGCQMQWAEKARMLPSLMRLGPASLVRMLLWQHMWQRHHPTVAHLHIGPLAVHHDWRGRGLGRELLDAVLASHGSDVGRRRAYLETDREVNVGFYRADGFTVVSEGDVLGQANWFMERCSETRTYERIQAYQPPIS